MTSSPRRINSEVISLVPSTTPVRVSASRHPGGTTTQTDAAAGVLDSKLGRLVSLPRRVGGDLYGSFLPGTQQNLERALDGLLELLPAGAWLDHTSDHAQASSRG
ncbi:ESX-1 secretion-associated protein EspG1 [Mycobacterium tuberculosis]|nr:ESX-1 secretion-associated protein EspG1 [Mycobacterium tuberculosis]